MISIRTTNPVTGEVSTEEHNNSEVSYQVDAQGVPLGYVLPGTGIAVPPAPHGDGWVWNFELTGWVPPIPDPKALIQQEIEALERTQLMPRATREFMLLFMETSFPAETLANNPGYVAVKTFDNTIKTLRGQLA
jgi:hypothetical protein